MEERVCHLEVGRPFYWYADTYKEKIIITEIIVNADDEVWIKSWGIESGHCWNSVEVFRERTTPVCPSWKDIVIRV